MNCLMMSSNDELKPLEQQFFTAILKDFKVDSYDSKYSSFLTLETLNKQSVNGSWLGHITSVLKPIVVSNVSRLNCPNLGTSLSILAGVMKQEF